MSEVITSQSQEKVQSVESLLETNPQLLNVMLAALSEDPLAQGLDQSSLIEICEAAFQAGRINDRIWLQERLEATRTGLPIDPKAPPKKAAYQEIAVSSPCQPENEEQWQEILSRHQDWIATVLHPNKAASGGRANLTGADLRNFDLSGLDLRGAILNDVNLEGCSLHKANLSTALLRNSKLDGADLTETNLQRADLSKSSVKEAKFQGADLRRAITEQVDFSQALGVEDAVRS